MLAEERKIRILEALERNRTVRVGDLGRLLKVSEASIRRDLHDLEESGLLRRTHGGALSNETAAAFEPSLAEKQDQYRAEKAAVAAVAVELVQEGDTIMLDAGSTTLQIARQLRRRRHVTVVTNSLSVASELAASRLEVVLTGGTLRRRLLSMVGPIAESVLSGLHVDKLFLGANGLHLEKGVTTPNLVEAQAKKAMLQSAEQVIVAADHSKIGRVAFSHVCGLESVHDLITDGAAPAEFVRAVEKLGVRVHVASGRKASGP